MFSSKTYKEVAMSMRIPKLTMKRVDLFSGYLIPPPATMKIMKRQLS